jgi:hypothetical protein
LKSQRTTTSAPTCVGHAVNTHDATIAANDAVFARTLKSSRIHMDYDQFVRRVCHPERSAAE